MLAMECDSLHLRLRYDGECREKQAPCRKKSVNVSWLSGKVCLNVETRECVCATYKGEPFSGKPEKIPSHQCNAPTNHAHPMGPLRGSLRRSLHEIHSSQKVAKESLMGFRTQLQCLRLRSSTDAPYMAQQIS